MPQNKRKSRGILLISVTMIICFGIVGFFFAVNSSEEVSFEVSKKETVIGDKGHYIVHTTDGDTFVNERTPTDRYIYEKLKVGKSYKCMSSGPKSTIPIVGKFRNLLDCEEI